MDEVQFRRGELLFSAKRYPEAEKAYAAVIGRGGTSTFYQQSLYKHGWSLFKQSLTLESLPSFGGVLDRDARHGARQAGAARERSSAPTASSSTTRCAS